MSDTASDAKAAGTQLKETERVQAGPGPGRGPFGGPMVGQKASTFGPSARRLVSRLRQRTRSRRPLSAGRLGVSQDPGGIRRGNGASHTQIPRHAITSSPSALICGAECDVIQVPA